MPYKVYQAQPGKQVETKVEPGTTADVEMAEAGGATNGAAKNGGVSPPKSLPLWLSKIKENGGVKKIPKNMQKRRWNFRLKKMLAPKSPSMLIYEVVNAKDVTFTSFESDKMIRVVATYDGKTFEGFGPSKTIAKNICAEQIFQHYVFKSCQKDETKGEEEVAVGKREEVTPWTALASLALFKLFNDWQAQGIHLPAELLARTHREPDAETAAMEVAKRERKEKKLNKEPRDGKPKALPENPQLRHPVQLLNEMCGRLEYECATEGEHPNGVFRTTVSVNGSLYSGVSRIKKESKKFAAQAAMTAIYNVQYPEEMS